MNVMLSLAAGLSVLVIAGTPAAAADALKPETRANLLAAMHGEAFAHLKYQAYAEVARAHGRQDLAKLFEEAANVEGDEHFAREANALKLAGADEANLADAIAGETYETTTMYVDFARAADEAGDTKVAAMFRQIAEDEADHQAKYEAALAKLKNR